MQWQEKATALPCEHTLYLDSLIVGLHPPDQGVSAERALNANIAAALGIKRIYQENKIENQVENKGITVFLGTELYARMAQH